MCFISLAAVLLFLERPSDVQASSAVSTIINKKGFITKETVVRRGAHVTYAQSGLLKAGEEVIAIVDFTNASGERWLKVQNTRISGWIPAAAFSRQTSVSPYTVKTTVSAAIRTSASSAYKILKTVPKDTILTVKQKFYNVSNEKWLYVQHGTTAGWMREDDTALAQAALKKAYLTFDDGPSSASGAALLNVLKQHGVAATFFMLEPQMRARPDLVKRMVSEGHTVGCHGVTHDKSKFYRDSHSALNEMTICQKTLQSISGVKSRLIRVPYGSKPMLTDSQKTALQKAGFLIWDWNVDSLDWKYTSGQYVSYTLNQIPAIERQKASPVVVLHDKNTTVQYLHQLISGLKTKGYGFSGLTETMTPMLFR
ncbi:polysaccharide deacetylase family protein [Fictibacillus iocasae]|uniref:Polysaccharide deacetylase family protein n=1 Tax=Fictibacillus iocasae TaxID=2715437 RepID=A0ABW2NUP5_9BACL